MHVLVVADSFPPVTSAAEVARALAAGWMDGAPHDVVTGRGLSAGGRGVVALLAEALGTTPRGDGPLVVEDGGADTRTAYVELPSLNDGTSHALGEQVSRALGCRPTRVVIGLDTGCAPGQVPDGGAGLLLALAVAAGCATARPMLGRLQREAEELGTAEAVRGLLTSRTDAWLEVVAAARTRLDGADLVGAVATDLPLLGLHGASAGAARQGRLTDAVAQDLERALGGFAHAVMSGAPAGPRLLPLAGRPAPSSSGRSLASTPGAGAGGGAGFALAALGGRLLPGAGVIAAAVGLDELVSAADLVVGARGELDGATFDVTVVGEAVRAAGAAGVPCLVVAGTSLMSRREYSAHGISALHVLGDDRTGSPTAGSTTGVVLDELRERAARLARSWSPAWLGGTAG